MNVFIFTDPCLVRYCGKGRECIIDSNGNSECICQKRCPKHEKLVCGTDGIIYPNHCELHRTACVEDRNIAVDHSFGCPKPKKKYNKHRGEYIMKYEGGEK